MQEQVRVPGLRGERNDLFRLLVESVKDYAIFLLDPNGYIQTWNEGAKRIKGYSADEIIGKHFSIFYPAQEVRRGKPEYELRVAADEGRWEEEGWRIRKDGTRFWANVLITALYDQEGVLIGFAKVTRDLTERWQAEEDRLTLLERERAAHAEAELWLEQLRAIQQVTEAALAHITLDDLLRALLDQICELQAVDAVTVLLASEEDDVLVVRAASGMNGMVGQGPQVPMGRGFAGRVASERRPILLEDALQAEMLDVHLGDNDLQSFLGVPLMVAGRVIGVLHIGTRRYRPFLPADVQFLQVVADRIALAIEHARLVESARAARIEVEVAERMLQMQDEFLSVAAHELKTPLTSAKLASQILCRNVDRLPPDLQRLRYPIDTIDLQVHKLSQLVIQLLEMVRLQAGRFSLTVIEVDMVALTRTVVDLMQQRTARHEIIIKADGPHVACVDTLRLEEVLTNLLDNAIKFGPEQTRIEVEVARPAPEMIRLSVRDYGPGVAPEQRQHLFERYFQAHNESHQSGLGLGLYISRQIVLQHGGQIVAEFPPDGGMRFVVTLPTGLAEPAAQDEAQV
jgi:PAS domain S-box-containing protein